MGKVTNIAWCDHSWNPWWGCIEVSAGCTRCYARTLAERWGHNVWGPAKTTPRRFFSDKHWQEPLKWNRDAEVAGVRRRVFCASMADVFEDNLALVGERAHLFRLIESTPSLDWLLLTKRPENLQAMLPHSWTHFEPMPNVWLGTSVEDQRAADERIPLLLQTPAAVRFLSCEPLLSAIDLSPWLEPDLPIWPEYSLPTPGRDYAEPLGDGGWIIRRRSEGPHRIEPWEPGISWLIAGGESGPNSRPCDPEWVRSLRDQCQAAHVAYFFKQWGGRTHAAGGRLLDGRTWDEFPEPARETVHA